MNPEGEKGKAAVGRICRKGSAISADWRFVAGAGAQALQIVVRPPNSAVLLTHYGQLLLGKKLVNLMPPDIRFYG